MRELTNQYDATITKQWRYKYQTTKSQADIQQKRGKPYTYMSVTPPFFFRYTPIKPVPFFPVKE